MLAMMEMMKERRKMGGVKSEEVNCNITMGKLPYQGRKIGSSHCMEAASCSSIHDGPQNLKR